MWPFSRIFKWWWERPSRGGVEGINLAAARAVREAVSVPVICAGGFQTQSVIAGAIEGGDCDAVSMARPLLANPDLPLLFAQGLDRAPKPCTYCNKCLVSFVDTPLGCYEEQPLRLARGDDPPGARRLRAGAARPWERPDDRAVTSSRSPSAT